jgi:2-polyprenyl-3-methyl-5-hydroxy-6-metoxy-1,4-benzoquinol methylase
MIDFWNQRYAQQIYAYGIEPNEFYKEQLSKLRPGKILFPAEGEGRNAVFAASLGWETWAFDSSLEAKRKAENLALAKKVKIDYAVTSIEDFAAKENSFDAIVSIFVHTPNRQVYHQKMIQLLKPGGILILEGFSKNQLGKNTGGPQNEALLFSEEELKKDFSSLKDLNISELDTHLSEGAHHQGKASVIRLLAKK